LFGLLGERDRKSGKTNSMYNDYPIVSFKNWKKIGELHIYADGREMNFI
jgi:hypothetical protein